MVRVVSLSSADLITRGLSAMHHVHGIRSLIGFGKRVCPLVLPVLYPREARSLIGFGKRVCPLVLPVLYPREAIHDAIPKYVSERTSYRPV